MQKKKGRLRFRHKVVVALLAPTFGLWVRLKYGVRIHRFWDKRPCLVVLNHQTAYDQFFVGLSFRRPVYYLASEDIFSMGWVSRIIEWLVAPIPIKKQTTDLQAVKSCILTAREGGTVCIAPEGNRTFHGRTLYMNPAIGGLAKKLDLPIAIFRIEGGYGVHPRWSDVVRKGRMEAFVSRVIEPEEYAGLSAGELAEWIGQELWVDEARVTGRFVHKKNAEFLERAMYVCPWCGLSEFESSGDIIRCKRCDCRVRHLPTKELEGINCDFPYRFVADWYDAQIDHVTQIDPLSLTVEPLYEEKARLSLVYPGKFKKLLAEETVVRLYGDRITLDEKAYPFRDITVVVLGKNKLNLYTPDGLLQLKGSKRFNALKYVNLYHRYQNATKGDPNGKFLGL